LRRECAQNYRDEHFPGQTGFDIARDPKVTEQGSGAAASRAAPSGWSTAVAGAAQWTHFVHRKLISSAHGMVYGLLSILV
jgi:hypothetical protein